MSRFSEKLKNLKMDKAKGEKSALVNDVSEELSAFKEEIKTEIDIKLENKLEDIDKVLAENSHKLSEAISQIKNGTDGKPADENKIIETVLKKIPKIDEVKLTDSILEQVPKVNEKTLINKVISAIPKNKPSLRVLRETFETDPMSVINKILKLPAGKFKLKTENIDGLEQTISSFRNQISNRGYLHGGGDSVKAGTNITITSNNDGTKTINATGGGGGVTSFNTRTGAVTLTSGDVTTALGFTPGVGTVTAIGVTTANGVSGVSSGGATPNLTLTLGAITPTSVNGITLSGSGSIANTGVSSLTGFTGSGSSSGANTGDQTIGGLGGVPTTRTLTINGTTFDLSANRTWSVGTITSISIASANGFAGTSSGGATPALTLSTSITGLLTGNGTAISAAVSGTDIKTVGGNSLLGAGDVPFPTNTARTLIAMPALGINGAVINMLQSVNTIMNIGQIIIPFQITANQVTFRVNGINTSGTLNVVMYSEDGQTQIFSFTTATLTVSLVLLTTSLGGLVIEPGVYYIGVSPNGTASINVSGFTNLITVTNQFGDSVTGKPVLGGTYTITADTIPATIDPTAIVGTNNKTMVARFDF